MKPKFCKGCGDKIVKKMKVYPNLCDLCANLRMEEVARAYTERERKLIIKEAVADAIRHSKTGGRFN